MEFDKVFDVTKAYRKIVHAFSYPGDIVSLSEECECLNKSWGVYPSTIMFMHMLLDTETSFAIDSKDDNLAIKFVNMTYSHMCEITDAAYIFVCREHTQNLSDIIKKASCGTLENPQKGATLIIECDRLYENGNLCLKGCGIQNEKMVGIEIKEAWLDARANKNAEFPLGIDMIFTDVYGNVMALPRTTHIRKG